jgi:hypothetical protein
MSLAIPSVYVNGVMERRIAPGDLLGLGESLKAGAISTAGTGTWAAANIATGIINRTGPTAGYTDTTDTAANIITALSGNAPLPDGMAGQTFRMRFINTVAYNHTLAAGTGVLLGSGSTLNTGSSGWREYLFTILNDSPPVTVSGTLVSASATVTLALPAGMVALPIGPSPLAVNITAGMGINSGSAGLQSSTTVLGIQQGQGGLTGIVMNNTATASGTISLNFTPTIQIDSLGGGTL